jgi:O-antigen ligase
LFAVCAAATLGISTATPFLALGYSVVIFGCAARLAWTSREWSRLAAERRLWIPLTALALWGFVQLALGFSEDRWETLLGALRFSSYAATALCARLITTRDCERRWWLGAIAWFGFAVAVAAVLAYYSSSSKVLWIFPSPYPDVWGPFLSRNNFAQFLELVVPVTLWLGLQPARGRVHPGVYLSMAACMVAAGFASASRAGGVFLIAEVIGVFSLSGRSSRKHLGRFAAATAICIAIAGAGYLVERFQSADPLVERREIYRSTVAMIRSNPWRGYGLGTFALVYPEFAEIDTGLIVDHAHNDWLEWSAEGGIVFVSLWALFAIPLCATAIRSIWGMGVAAVFLHAFVDYPFARHGVAVWLFLLAGLLQSSRNSKGVFS